MNKKVFRKTISLILQLAVFATVLFFAVREVTNEHFEGAAALRAFGRAFGNSLLLVILTVLLLPVNWALEALKWQYLARKTVQISFRESFAGVLAGLAVGFVLPQTAGDCAGRILRLDSKDRIKAAGAVLLGNTAQLFVAVFIGGLSGIIFLIKNPSFFSLTPLVSSLLFVGVVLVFIGILFFSRPFLRILSTIKLLQKPMKAVESFGAFSPSETGKVLLISLVRYLVFTVQFILLLKAFGVNTDGGGLFAGAAFVFLMKTIIPKVNFTADLGVRELAAGFFFGGIGASVEPVIAASLCLWLINLFIPMLAGIIFVPKIKLSLRS